MRYAPIGIRSLVADAADLVLGRCCQVCTASGPELCHSCLHALRAEQRVRPHLPGQPRVVAATTYAGVSRALVLAYKEDGHRSLAAPLGLLLSDAVGEILADLAVRRATLVPIPGHSRPRRGFDALDGVLQHACSELGRRGIGAGTMRLLRSRVDYPAAKALSREERRHHLAGAFTVSTAYSGGPIGPESGPLIVVDDVITTGATVTEALRALRAAGFAVAGVAAVSATR